MEKFCPFMSINPTILEKKEPIEKTVPCLKNCALYCEGYCSINVLAQKTIHDFKKEKKEKEKSVSE